MENVASVIMNRYICREGKGYASWGPTRGTIAQICKAPYQFSCWNTSDPNLARCIAVNTNDAVFRVALEVAGQAIAGTLTIPHGRRGSLLRVVNALASELGKSASRR